MVAIPLDSLPLGFRFHPTDEELVNHYLKRKIDGRINSDPAVVIPEVDVCKCEPWDLPDKSLIRSDDPEWFFFSPKDRKYPNGHRSNRATEAGYWKATGKDRIIRSRGRNVIGTKKTLVFHRGRAPKGMRTGWIMHEYRTVEPEFEAGDQGGFVLCRLFKKSEDKSSSLNETRGDDLSPTPTRSSPGDTHTEPDPMEELGTPTDQEFPVSNVLEDQQQLEDKAGCSTVHAQKPGENLCTGNAASDTVTYELQVVAEQGDPVMDDLLQFTTGYDQPDFEGFPQISSPVHPFTDYPFFGDMDLESHIQLFHDDIAEHNSVTEFLGSVLNNLDDYSSEVSSIQGDSVFTSQINVIESVTPMFAWESSECKDIDVQERNNYSSDSKSGDDSVCSSDVDTEVGITKGKEYASSALFYKQPHVSGYPWPVNYHGRSHEIKTQPDNLCQNNDKISLCEKIIPVGFTGDSSAYASSYPLNMDQSVNIIQKKDGFVEDKTKTMTQLDSSPYCLNHPFKTEEMNFNEIEDGSMKNKAMAQLQGHQPVSDPEQSPNQANFIDTKDVLEGTGIRIKSRLPDYRPNSSASIPQQGTSFRRIRFQRKMVKRIPSRRYIQLQKVSSSRNISGGNKDQDVKSQVSKPLERAECYIARETEDECSGDQDEIESFSNQDEPCLTRVDTSQDSEPSVKLRSRGIKYQTANLIGLRTGEVRPEAGSDSHATGRFRRCVTWVMPIIIVLLIWLAVSWCFLSRCF